VLRLQQLERSTSPFPSSSRFFRISRDFLECECEDAEGRNQGTSLGGETGGGDALRNGSDQRVDVAAGGRGQPDGQDEDICSPPTRR
jgi:hypothetical protein